MKILITGATGFIGKHLTRRLLEHKYDIYSIIRKSSAKKNLDKKNIKYFIDGNSIKELITFFKKERFDGVIHLASCFIVEHKSEEIADLVNSNILFSTKVLEASVITNVHWFINTGTFWQHYQNKEYSPVNLYAATKQAFEVIAKFYMETSSINFVTLKLNDTYGPGDTRPKIFNIWKKIAENGETLVMSTGEQLIDMTYIDDVIDAYIKMIELIKNDELKSFSGKSFIVSSDRLIKLKELADIFSKVTQKRLNINWGGKSYRKREVMMPWNKGERIPGWNPKVSFEEGMRKIFISS